MTTSHRHPWALRLTFCLVMALGLYGAGACWHAQRVTGFSPRGSLLSPVQMSAIVGDAFQVSCTANLNCRDALLYGPTGCAFCDVGGGWMACCAGKGQNCSTCTRNGGAACPNSKLMVGTMLGQAGTCGTCTAPSYGQQGFCSNLANADNKCPCTAVP
jgi:hypothetical protein